MSSIELVGGWSSIIANLLSGEHLSSADAEVAMTAILRGEAQPSQIAAFVVALRAKGESADELQGMLAAVIGASGVVELPDKIAARAIDIVGTGGDKSHSVNISTMASLVVARAGFPVCKLGKRAAS